MARKLLQSLAALGLLLALPLAASAAGGLDPAFGSAGLVKTRLGFDSIAWAVAVQPDGKPVIGGFGSVVGPGGELGHTWIAARYTQAGALDTSFDGDGVAATTFSSRPTPYDSAQDVAIQPDGKIVAAGTAVIGNSERFALARYNPDGSLDPSFGSGGKVITDFGAQTSSRATSMALAGNGKIVVAGATYPTGTISKLDFALARYNSDGSLDASFGSGGKVVTDLGADDEADDVAVLGNGKLVAAGVAGSVVAAQPHVAVVRYNADGTLDSSFGDAGKLVLGMNGIGVATAVLVQSDGKLLVAGGRQRTELIPTRAFLMRLTSSGAIDKSYGVGGSTEQPAFSFSALTFDSRGGTVAVGDVLASYSESGVFVRDFEPDFAALGVAVAPGGKIVAAGTQSFEGSQHTIALARYVAVECVVPGLRGKSLTSARLALRRASCSLGAVRHVHSRNTPPGRVLAQTPAAGKRLAAGSPVNVTLSRPKS